MEVLALTSKTDRGYAENRKRTFKLRGQLRESRSREQLHEETHQDEFSN
jgi:hypothetical protein